VSWVDLGPAEPAAPDEVRDVRVGARLVGLARVGEGWVAFDPWCTHAECPLTDGWLEGDALRCACHGALFDLSTGAPLEGPAVEPIRLFPTRVVDEHIEADVG
jgi:3-phenylpropionate/trans-cinnamate dioxygenase ferredoxin subunit